MSIYFREESGQIIVFGNTFPYRDMLRNLAGQFDRSRSVWILPRSEKNIQSIDILCRNAGGGTIAPPVSAIAKSSEVDANDYSISQLLNRVGGLIKSEFNEPLWIYGEIQNYQIRSTGSYFQLSEIKKESLSESATLSINATIWKNQLIALMRSHKDLNSILADGVKIRCQVLVNFYKDRAILSLNVIAIDPAFTLGELALNRQNIIKDLKKRNLYDANRRLSLRPFPFYVGLITADQSRAYGDFVHQLQSHGFPGTVLFTPASMQGEATSRTVIEALNLLTDKSCDLIVLIRGGGSAADLRWFDDLRLAEAIAHSPIPIICAIGHHDDTSVAEEICFYREKTPTAAADYIIRHWENIRKKLEMNWTDIQNLAQINLRNQEQKLALIEQRFFNTRARVLGQLDLRIVELKSNLKLASMKALANFRESYLKVLAHLKQSDPTAWLEKGWTQLTLNKVPVISLSQLQLGFHLDARLKDGSLSVEVKELTKNT